MLIIPIFVALSVAALRSSLKSDRGPPSWFTVFSSMSLPKPNLWRQTSCFLLHNWHSVTDSEWRGGREKGRGNERDKQSSHVEGPGNGGVECGCAGGKQLHQQQFRHKLVFSERVNNFFLNFLQHDKNDLDILFVPKPGSHHQVDLPSQVTIPVIEALLLVGLPVPFSPSEQISNKCFLPSDGSTSFP